MYKITEGNFKEEKYGEEPYLNNWPMLYLLDNDEQIYIGQSNHVKTRMKQHHSSKEKSIFNKVRFIYSNKFNQSVTLDFESKLIQYIAADELMVVTNRNEGIADKEYYDKKHYDEDFYKLWNKLRREKIVKHSLEELENSDLFKFSPFKELNDDQREAIDEIIEILEEEKNSAIVVNGMPGSGKTILAIYLLKYLKDSDEYGELDIALVVQPKSLRQTLQKVFKSIYNLKASDVIGPTEVTRKKYDILIVDEAHRLHQYKNISYMGPYADACNRIGLTKEDDELDWILHQCDRAVIMYDRFQVVGPSGIDIERFDKKMKREQKKRMVTYYSLLKQMRLLGGNEYIHYVEDIINVKAKEKKTFDNYEFAIINDFAKFNELMYQKEEENTLVRMVAGYAWPWNSKHKDVSYDIELDGIQKMWNHCTEGWVMSEGAIDEVGCIHSIQGYDLNYAFVIIGEEIGFDKEQQEIIIRKENYYDQNGKKTADYEELLSYIKNIYYVLFTRGMKGTFLYVCDKDLKEYLSNYIEVI